MPEEALLAPPSPTPSPSPSPAPSPSPSPAPDGGASREEGSSLESAFDSKFPAGDGDEPSTPATIPYERKAKPAAEAPKPAPAKPTPAANGKAAATAPVKDEFALPQEIAESKDMKRVRDFAYGQNKTAKTLEREKLALETKLREIEATVPKTIAERDALATKIKDFEQRTASYEERMRLIDFKQSDKYKTEFEKPYVEAFNEAAVDIAKCPLTFDDPAGAIDPETQAVKKITRQGTSSDLAYLIGLDRRNARVEAQKHFPDDWQDIMAHYDKVVPLRKGAIKAEAEYKEKWKSIEQETTARRASENSQVSEAWNKVNEELTSKNPHFAPREDDTDGNAMLEKGFNLADLFFSDNREKLSLKDRVILDANVRNRVAAHPRLVRDLAAKDTEIAQLKKDLEELRGSRPGAPRHQGGEHIETPDDSGDINVRFNKRF